MPAHLIDTRSNIIDVSTGQDWPSEDRIDRIGQWAGTGEHYPITDPRTLDDLRLKEAYHEEQLAFTREMMREEINRLNLNKVTA